MMWPDPAIDRAISDILGILADLSRRIEGLEALTESLDHTNDNLIDRIEALEHEA